MKCKQFIMRLVFLCTLFGVPRQGYPLAQSAGPEGCNVRAVHDLELTGRDVSIGIISVRHCRYTHEAFYDKDADGNPTGDSHAHWHDPTEDPVSPYEPFWHDTTMAGIAAGRGGKKYPDYLGMAPDADIYSVKISRQKSASDPNREYSFYWFQKALDYLLDQDCRIVVTGMQFPVSYDNSYPFTLLYDYYAYTHDMIFANAAGNDEDSITIFGTAFNGLTTAGLVTTDPDVYRQVGSRSNPGFTEDDRRKPDICAPAKDLWVPTASGNTAWKNEGYNGETSWSGPHAAGVAALLVSFADNSPEPDDGRGPVIRAVMVNSAFPNIRDRDGNLTTGQVWDPCRGYGRVDALRTLNLLSGPKMDLDIPADPNVGWAHNQLRAKRTHTYQIRDIPIHSRLVVTLTWNRRVLWIDNVYNKKIDPGELTATLADLDLQVYDPDEQPLFSSLSAIDNLEKIDLRLTAGGNYRIAVINKSANQSADYALAFEVIEPIPGDFNGDAVVDSKDFARLSSRLFEILCPESEPWLSRLDLNGDGIINFYDFEEFANCWLNKDDRYCLLP